MEKIINKENKDLIRENIKNNLKIFEDINFSRKEISKIFLILEKNESLDFKKLILIENLENSEIKELFVFDEENLGKKRCQLCLHDIDIDGKTNIFSGEFHILCINYWINVIDNNSPFNF